jgi:hypothetical protein
MALLLCWGVAPRADAAQTDIDQVRFIEFLSEGQIKVKAEGTELILEGGAEVAVIAAGRPISLAGIVSDTPVELAYEFPAPDEKGQAFGVAQRCATDGDCRALRINLLYESGIWRNELAFGVEFSQERGGLSQQDLVLNYTSDTLLWESSSRRRRFHLVPR